MAKDYRPVAREQEFLLPPAVTDWLPDDHLVWFVIEAVKQLDTSAFHTVARLGGVGRRGYDPDMLVSLFVYAMAHAVTSSREMERLCQTDLAFMIVCAMDAPDHTVLCRFRQTHHEALADLLTGSLQLAAELGFVQFGTVAIDGTKIAANASKDVNRTEGGLRAIAERHLAETEQTDRAEDELFGQDHRGDELPEKVTDRTHRGRRIADALEVVRQRKAAERKAADEQQARAAEYVAKVRSGHNQAGQRPKGVDPEAAAWARYQREWERQDAARADWDAKAAAGNRPGGRRPKPADEHHLVRQAHQAWQDTGHHTPARDDTQAATSSSAADSQHTTKEPKANLTDPQSRLMKTRNGWLQGYNCFTGVTADWFIGYADATDNPIDIDQYQPVVDALSHLADQLPDHPDRTTGIGTVLADAGFDSTTNLQTPGPDRLIANGNRRTLNQQATTNPAVGDPPADATTREQMDHRLRTTDGHTTYKRRAPLAETPNAWLKDLRGLRQFSRRGLSAARSEFRLAAAVTNLLRLRALGITTTQLTSR